MKRVLFLLVAVLAFGSISAQEKAEKVKRSQAKSIVKELTQPEKIKLLNEIIANHPKIMDKALVKALRKTDKKKVDSFMARRGKDFKVLEKDKIVQRAEKTTKAPKMVKKTKTPKVEKVVKATKSPKASKVVKAPKAPKAPKVEKGHEGHDHSDHKGHDHAAKPKATYVVKDVNAPAATTIAFDESTFDFGTITDGESVTHTYKFTNTGKNPYIITNAKGSCGCTVPKWSREPIAPGATSEIVVTFNSRGKGRAGGANQSKRVTISGNTEPAQTYLTIKGIVNK